MHKLCFKIVCINSSVEFKNFKFVPQRFEEVLSCVDHQLFVIISQKLKNKFGKILGYLWLLC